MSSRNKSKEYLYSLLEYKEKWAICYHPSIFDAGVTTTSKAESNNAAVKRYLSSRSEISDLRVFI